jgi:2-dehydropantoate 2-reductase
VVLGHLQGGPTKGEVEPLLNALMRAGVQAEWTDNGPAAVWMKVLLNIAINPIAALSGVENGGLLAPNLFSSALETMLEGASIARAERVFLPDDLELEHHLQRVLESTAENQCSMLQDVRAGRTTEVAYLNQAVVERGERIGVRAPMNHMLSAMIEALTPDLNQR